MNRFMRPTASVLVLVAMAAFVPAQAQEGEVDAMIEELRDQIQGQREALIEANLVLTSKQREDFWPLYEEYHGKRGKLVDRRVALLTKFRDDRIGVTAENAEEILIEAIKIEKELVDLKGKYRKNFVKVLLPRAALRYYQIENKIDATINYDLAKVVPLQPK